MPLTRGPRSVPGERLNRCYLFALHSPRESPEYPALFNSRIELNLDCDVIAILLFPGTAGEVDEITAHPTAAGDHKCAVIAMC